MDHEYDFFTAVDDLNEGIEGSEDHGAGHLGDTEFTSSVFYKYISCDYDELKKNLGDDEELSIKSIKTFIKSAVFAQPTGKQNSFAAHNLPELLVVEIKNQKIPISYTNAFLKPVVAFNNKSIIDNSAEVLNEYMTKIKKAYSIDSKVLYLSLTDSFEKREGMENYNDLNSLIDKIEETIKKG